MDDLTGNQGLLPKFGIIVNYKLIISLIEIDPKTIWLLNYTVEPANVIESVTEKLLTATKQERKSSWHYQRRVFSKKIELI